MGAKNNDETIKYEIICSISVDGVASEADIVGALFGQTEGLLDREMDLKQLQKSGRIGRINLNIFVKSGKTKGKIRLPSSMNKIETSVIAATLETVDRVGPCECRIILENLSDVRKDKREQIAKRASEIMKKWELESKRNNKDIAAFVEKDTMIGKIQSFGPDKLPAGPEVFDNSEIILVEGRADVLNLMKMNINNTIGIQGTKVSPSIKSLTKTREITALLDGDRGGDMILKELALFGKIEYIARAPFKREVEDLKYDDVIKALDERVPMLDAKFLTEDQYVADFLGVERSKGQTTHKKRSKKSNGKAIVKPTLVKTKNKDKSPRRDRNSSPRVNRNKSSRDDASSRYGHRNTQKGDRTDNRRTDRDDRNRRGGNRRSSRSKGRDRRRDSDRKPRITVPSAIISLANGIKSTFKAILVGKSHEPIVTIETKEVYKTLQETDGVESIIIDGVITQRLLDEAQEKQVKLVAGAVIGEISKRPNELQFTTFNRM